MQVERKTVAENQRRKKTATVNQDLTADLFRQRLRSMKYSFEKSMLSEEATRKTKSMFSQFDLINKIMQNMG